LKVILGLQLVQPSSSDKSLQSFNPSHFAEFGKHPLLPVTLHLNSVAEQLQFNSSLTSRQSLSTLHTRLKSIQLPLSHWNLVLGQAGDGVADVMPVRVDNICEDDGLIELLTLAALCGLTLDALAVLPVLAPLGMLLPTEAARVVLPVPELDMLPAVAPLGVLPPAMDALVVLLAPLGMLPAMAVLGLLPPTEDAFTVLPEGTAMVDV
jgi:hypothetical protein